MVMRSAIWGHNGAQMGPGHPVPLQVERVCVSFERASHIVGWAAGGVPSCGRQRAVPAAKPLNEFQLEVLGWIAAGCPEQEWPDESHKHSAGALQSRGLAHVARRKGVWVAEITDAGRHYVTHGDYPAHMLQPSPRLVRSARRVAAPRSGEVDSVDSITQPGLGAPVDLGPSAPTEGQWLLLRLLAAGGRLEVDTGQERAALHELRAAPYLPPGKVLKTRGRDWYHQMVYLRDDPRAIVPEREIRVPSRLTKPHPRARAYRADRDRQEVSASALARATRLVHALAATLEVLGYDFRSGEHTPDGQFLVVGEGGSIPIRISEKSAPGGAAVGYDPWRTRPLPAWQARRHTQFIPTGRLTILVGGQYGGAHGRQCRFNDTKARPLEDCLPLVVREVETRLFERRQDCPWP